MTRRASVLFYVQHLLGTGHIRRTALIARAVAARGIEVVVASGGFPVSNLEWGQAVVWQLPPIRSRDSEFSALIDKHGIEIDDVFKITRREQLLACYEKTKPSAVVIETFPFGRRQLCFELLPLLEQIHQQKTPPKLLCSIRDVLQLRKTNRRQETLQMLNNYFDTVLVHGDVGFIPLGDSFPEVNHVGSEVIYTGYVTDKINSQVSTVGNDEIIVAAGGGAAAGNLFRCAIEASQLCEHLGKSWRLLVGAVIQVEEFQSFSGQQTKNLIVERNRSDYPGLLQNAALSVSQAGYNTVLDVLQSGVRALFVPFAGTGETEQLMRAEKLQRLGRADVLREEELSGLTLTQAVIASLQAPEPKQLAIDINGVNRSTEFIVNQLRR